MALDGQSRPQVLHSTTQLKGLRTFAFCACSSNSSTPFSQNSTQVRQPVHFSASMVGYQGIFSRGMLRQSLMAFFFLRFY
jgi:hypothetical protein